MIDTVKVQSPSIPFELARCVEHRLDVKGGYGPVDLETGERKSLYELYAGQVRDEERHGGIHGINVRVMRTRVMSISELKRDPSPVVGAYHAGSIMLAEKKRTVSVPCDPYLWMEGSVHKAMLGHNVWGGPRNLSASVSWLVADVSRRLGLELPEWSSWDLMRADWAETYDLGSYDNVQDYVRSLNAARFPRRQPHRYGDDSLLFPGRVTSLRLYHKGPEFAGKEFKALSRVLAAEDLHDLARRAHTASGSRSASSARR